MTHDLITPALARQIEEFIHARQADSEGFIRALVETESPSGDEAGSRAVVDLLAEAANKLDCVSHVRRVDVAGFGQHLVVHAFNQRQNGNILLVGHTDTVHSGGSVSERPWRKEHNRIYGPGIFDMKANCALAIEVLRAFDALKIFPRYGITLALTCDEEVGSLSGWPMLEGIAHSESPRCALVLEPSAAGGRVKTGRKGTGIFAIKCEGKAAHAGLDPEKGASAILELARQTERLHALNQSGPGIGVNVGVVRCGTKSILGAADPE